MAKLWSNFSAQVHFKLLMPGIFCLWLLSEINGAILHQLVQGRMFDAEKRWGAGIHVQMALLVVGIALITLGLTWKSYRRPNAQKHVPATLPAKPVTRYKLALLVLIVMFAFLVRVWNLENEIHQYIDEYNILKSVTDLNWYPETRILTDYDRIATFPWVWNYVEKIVTDLLGHNLLGLRLQSAVVGTMTVIAVYLLAQTLYGVRVGLMAAAFMATFSPHVHFSRLMMLQTMSPLLGVLALYFVVRGVQTGRQRCYIVGGILLGLLAYYDESGRLVFPPVIVGWLLWLRLLNSPRRAHRGDIAWLLLAAVLVSFPVYYTKLGYRAPLFPRMVQNGQRPDMFDIVELLFTGNGMQNLGFLLRKQVLPPFLHYVTLPDTSQLYYGGGTALVLPWMLPLFFTGVGLMFRRFGGFMILLWAAGVALGNSLLAWSTWTARYMCATPVLVILMAVGLDFWLKAFQHLSNSAGQPPQRAWHRFIPGRTSGWFSALSTQYAALLFTLAFTLSQFIYYFGVHLPEFRATIQPFPDYADVAYRVRDLPPDTVIFFVYIDLAFVQHMEQLYDFWGVKPTVYSVGAVGVTPETLAELATDRNYAFFLDQRDQETPAELLTHWRTLPEPIFSPYHIAPHRQYALYLIPAGSETIPKAVAGDQVESEE